MSAVPPAVLAGNAGASSEQYLRRVELLVSNAQDSLDLSDFQVQFRTTQTDGSMPNVARIRVWNVSPQTATIVGQKYTTVILNAGYQTGNFGLIFRGQIIQYQRGRLNALDSYLDLFVSDTDPWLTYGFVNKALPKEQNTPQGQYQAIYEAATSWGVTAGVTQGPAAGQGSGTPVQGGTPFASTGGVVPRGKVLMGGAIMEMRRQAKNTDSTWSVQNGKLTVLARTGYAPGEVVVINAQTGMIGQPEATDEGIRVRILLNPTIQIGQRVKINNADINQTLWRGQSSSGPPGAVGSANGPPVGFPGFGDVPFFASVTDDGIYRALVIEHHGDTRGNDYYSELVCLALDQSATSAATGQQGVPTDTQPAAQDQDFSGGIAENETGQVIPLPPAEDETGQVIPLPPVNQAGQVIPLPPANQEGEVVPIPPPVTPIPPRSRLPAAR